MYGLSIYEIKRICLRAYFFIISYGSFQHLTNSQNRIAMTRDFQQYGILTSVDSDEPEQPLLNLETPNYVQSVA